MRLAGSARPVPAMSKAVPWSGEVRTKGRPSVTLTRVIEGQRLDRDQRLVVIHAQRRVVARARPFMKQRIGRQRAARIDAFGDEPRDRRRNDGAVLLAERAFFAGMRIEPGDGEPRPRDAETARADRARRCGRSRRSSSVESCLKISFSGRWIVTGTTASSGDHSIITGRTALPVASARASPKTRCGRARRSRICRGRSWPPDW